MKKYNYVVIAFVLLFPSAHISHGQKPIAKPKDQKLEAKFPGYSFEVRINADKSSNIDIRTGYEFQDLDNGQLRKALSEYLLMQSPGLGHKPVDPVVSIRPDETSDMQTIFDVIKTVRVSESAGVTVATPDGQTLDIPVDPKFIKNQDVRPNPLFLLLVINERKNITLNNEEFGSLANPSPLIAKLKNIFHEREINGVTRENSLDVEKSINISIARTAKFKDLNVIAKILGDAGASPLVLQVDTYEILEAPRPKIKR